MTSHTNPADGQQGPRDPNLERATEVEGYRVLPPCVLYGKIGQGGMGAVYRGRHLNLDIDVAVKLLKPGLTEGEEEFVLRFKREARSAAQINHQNVVRVFDVAEDQGVHYLVMELVQGETARERVGRKGALAVGEALQVVYGAALGLNEAHQKGFVHRDIKPDNIMVAANGQVKLADLGLAKPTIRRDDSLMSVAGVVMGTPQYMPPEQWQDSSAVTEASDVWALGATLYFLLVGEEAIARDALPAVMNRICNRPFPDPRDKKKDIPDDVAELVLRATAREPDKRFLDAGEFAAAIEALKTRREALRDNAHEPGEEQMTLLSPPPAKTLARIKFWLEEQTKKARTERQTGPVDGGAGAGAAAAQPAGTQSAAAAPKAAPAAAAPAPSPAGSSRRSALWFAAVLVVVAVGAVFVRPWIGGRPAAPATGEVATAQPGAAAPTPSTPVEANPVEANPVGANPVEAKPVDAKPFEPKPAEAKPVAAKPVELPPATLTPATLTPAPVPQMAPDAAAQLDDSLRAQAVGHAAAAEATLRRLLERVADAERVRVAASADIERLLAERRAGSGSAAALAELDATIERARDALWMAERRSTALRTRADRDEPEVQRLLAAARAGLDAGRYDEPTRQALVNASDRVTAFERFVADLDELLPRRHAALPAASVLAPVVMQPGANDRPLALRAIDDALRHVDAQWEQGRGDGVRERLDAVAFLTAPEQVERWRTLVQHEREANDHLVRWRGVVPLGFAHDTLAHVEAAREGLLGSDAAEADRALALAKAALLRAADWRPVAQDVEALRTIERALAEDLPTEALLQANASVQQLVDEPSIGVDAYRAGVAAWPDRLAAALLLWHGEQPVAADARFAKHAIALRDRATGERRADLQRVLAEITERAEATQRALAAALAVEELLRRPWAAAVPGFAAAVQALAAAAEALRDGKLAHAEQQPRAAEVLATAQRLMATFADASAERATASADDDEVAAIAAWLATTSPKHPSLPALEQRAQAAAARAAAERPRRLLAERGFVPAADAATDATTGWPTRIVHEKSGITLRFVPAGTFLMGSLPDEADRQPNERQHRRTIDEPYYLGETEVTQAEWNRVLGENPSHFASDDLPVEKVRLADCERFCQQAGGGLRLPSEAEWEYACRAGSTAPFATGATITTDAANYDGNYAYGSGSTGTYRERTVPARSLPANAWGFFEMHGNVAEWCQDQLADYPASGTQAPQVSAGDPNKTARVIRGGSWSSFPRELRAASRRGHLPANADFTIGLRVAISLPR
jgi:formylglycine-generating enzyme required for sulfatase activity